MAELIENSVLLYGKDIRKELKFPTFHEIYADVKRHYETIRKDAQSTGRSFDYAETLAEPIHRFADVLDKELKKNYYYE